MPSTSTTDSDMGGTTVMHTPELESSSTTWPGLGFGKGGKVEEDVEKDAEKSGSVYRGRGTESDPYIVDWLEDDPENPLRWNIWKKGTIVAVAAISTLCVAYASSAYAGGMSPMLEYFKVQQIILILGITLFVLGFALGPLIWAPLSEIFGRRPIVLVTYFPFTMFCMACALAKNLETMLVCRFLSGTFGACLLTNAGGTTADLFTAKSRGVAMAWFAVAPFLGPELGPVASSFLANSSLGWRANFWLMFIFGMIMFFCNLFLCPETYAPVLLRKKAEKLSETAKKEGREDVWYLSVLDEGKPKQTVAARFSSSIFRPFELLFRELIVALLSIYMAYIYGLLYMTFSSYPIIFHQQRGWSQGETGLSFLGTAVGSLIGNFFYMFENKRYARLLEQHQSKYPGQNLPPEARLPAAILGAVLIPVGLLIFAFTSYNHVHWIFSILAGIPFGAGMLFVFLCCQNYMIDAYLAYAASALAANAVLRALMGSVFPLFTTQMYHRLGNVWASALPGFLALAGVPIPWMFMKYGARIRKNSKYAPGHVPAPADQPSLMEEQRDMDRAQELERIESLREAAESRASRLHKTQSRHSQT